MNSITQDMKFRQSLLTFAKKYGVAKASRRYNKARHPNQHTPEELAMILRYRRRNPKLGLIELWDRLRKAGYKRRPESLYRVLRRLNLVECVQTDNGSEFTTRLLSKSEQSQTLFEKTAADLDIKVKHIKPYTPRHNGKVG